ncbi:MAG: glycosyltransferase family 2 protein [Prevotellaceae bacterium]|nr:glycosyltransferase family 2 protein [Prevotellaceae bacterium]
MKVSICIPVYKVERYIERCAKSLFEQTYENIEYIFINDCTTDKSISVLDKLISNYPKRKKNVRIVHHKKNRGLAAARNTGVEEAIGEFILWVDSDDSIDRLLVEKLVKLQEEKNADIVCYDLKVLFSNRTEYYRNVNYSDGKDLCLKMLQDIAPHQLCGHLIRRSLYKENNITAKEGVNQAEDYQVMPRLAYYANRVATLHEALYFYDRTTENSFSNSFNVSKSIQISKAEAILSKFFQDKESIFIEQLEKSSADSIVRRMKLLSLQGDEVKEHYKDLTIKLKKISPNVMRSLRFDFRVIAMIRSKICVRYITKLSNLFYIIFHKSKSIISK